jgi:type II secretory pathway pseudopilin PulG
MAFTIAEVIVASGLLGIIALGAMGGFSSGFSSVRMDREISRATQVLLEKMELVRLYNWDQVTGNDTNIFLPSTFSVPFYPSSNSNGGFDYAGTVTVTNAPITETYSNNLKLVTVAVTWKSGKVRQYRSMSTYVSRYGLQNYIY